MPLTHRQNDLLHLAGTVRLPTPYPATGTVSIIAPAVAPEAECPDETIILRLTHRVSDRLDVIRLFRLSDVRAIRAIWPPEPIEAGDPIQYPTQAGAYVPAWGPWRELRIADAIVNAVAARLEVDRSDCVWLREASVYLPEPAPVVLESQAAMSAAESAEYYPPIVQAGPRSAGGVASFASSPMECNYEEETECVQAGPRSAGGAAPFASSPTECNKEEETE